MIQTLKKNWLPLALITIISLLALKSLYQPGLYTSHDGETHTARLANFYLAVKEGQLPPQLAPTLFGGFGFPIFIFIYPLPYAVGSIYHLLGASYVAATKLVFASSFALSGLFMYLFLKQETKSKLTAFVSTLFFLFAPYRFLLIFVRGAFAESFAYVFIASSLWCLHHLSKRRNLYWTIITGFSLTGLLLSHQLVSVMFLPVLTWYVLYQALTNRQHWFQIISQYFAALIFGFSLSAYIYLPVFLERHFLRFDNLISYTDQHFVTLWQLVRSPWGYGFSHPGVANDAMSFQLGLTQIVALTLSFIMVLLAVLIKKTTVLEDKEISNLIWWLIPTIFSIVLVLEHPITKYIWHNLPLVSIVDFPWRFLGVTVVCISLISAPLLAKLRNNFFLIIFFTFFVLYANRNHLRINQPVSFDDNYFENYKGTATWVNEFLPKTRITNQWQKIDGEFSFQNGEAAAKEIIESSTQVKLKITVQEPTELVIHRMFYPGWVVIHNNQILEKGKDFQVIDRDVDSFTGLDHSSFIKLPLEIGEHTITATFTPTPVRRIGKIISTSTLFLMTILLIKTKIYANKK